MAENQKRENGDIQSPGEVIESYIIKGLGISAIKLANALNVPPNRLYQIMQNKREISIDTAIRLGYFLDMEPSFWLDIQTQYQLAQFKDKQTLKDEVRPLKKP